MNFIKNALIKLSIFVALTATGIYMLAISWRRWSDILVDFGRELYVPWQINCGAVLYRDIGYFNGPLSSYLNAFVFRLLGTCLMSIALFNILLTAILTIILYRIFYTFSDRITAFLTSLTFLTMFAASHYIIYGNYNFICPYSHDMTHGVLLSFAAIYIFYLYILRRSSVLLCLLGMLLGLVFLTKIEVFVACGLSISSGLTAFFIVTREKPQSIIKTIFIMCASAAIPLAGFAIFFMSHMSMADILSSIMASYRSIFKSDITLGTFYKSISGLDDPITNIAETAYTAILYCTILSISALTGAALSRISDKLTRRAVSVVFIIDLILWLRYLAYKTEWVTMSARGLPVAMAFLLLFLFYKLRGLRVSGYDKSELPRTMLIFSVTVFSTVLLLKMLINVHVYHYGFALAMPAFLLLVAVFIYFAPKYFEKRSGGGAFIRAVGIVLLATCIYAHIYYSKYMLDRKVYPIGHDADGMLMNKNRIDPKVLNQAIDKIGSVIPKGGSMVVMPEGVMLNYLARIKNPTPYINFMPLEFSVFGEDNILKSFKASPPDYIVITNRETSEYGYRFFGRDYGTRIYAWIQDNYSPFMLFGKEPLKGQGFGIRVLNKRK